MKARLSLRFLSTALVAALGAYAWAARGDYSGTRQTADEVEDIGLIAESADSSVDPKDSKKTVVPPEEPKRFRFNVGARAQYTSNAELTGHHDSNDVIFFPSIEAGFHTTLDDAKKFSFDTALRLESGIYADRTNRSFIGYSLQSTLDFRPQPNLPRIFIGFEPYRYDNYSEKGLITEALAVSAGTDYGIAFNSGKSMAFIGYTFSNHFSDPHKDSRNAHTAIAGVTHQFLPQFYGQLFYQFENSNFYDADRDDNRHVVGLNLTYQLSRYMFATVGGNFTDNHSTDSRAAYQAAGASLGLNFQY